MERDLISHIAHADHPIAAPISEENLARLLRRTKLPAGARVLDLGCGTAFWSVRALELYGDAVADGVDLSAHALESAGQLAEERGVADRLRLHLSPAADFTSGEPYDLVMCVGSTHAYGGLTQTLEAVAGFLEPGGLVLVGEGFWEVAPDPELEKEIGDYPDLAGIVAQAESHGYDTVYAHVSERGEWYDYEWSWTGTLLDWARRHPGADGDQARAAALEHREMWLRGYRDKLGFVTMLLSRAG